MNNARRHRIRLFVFLVFITIALFAYTQQKESPTPPHPPKQPPKTLLGQPVPNNPLVADRLQEAIAFHIDHAAKTSLILSRMSELAPYVTDILSRYGLHSDYLYLFAWESGLKANANSGKAVGFAQFVSYTGSRYGLTITPIGNANGIWDIDERRCPAAFEAAARHLQDLEEEFNNPLLAAAAYNAGTGHIKAKTQEQEGTNYWELFFNHETEYYLYYILALKTVHEENAVSYTLRPPIAFETRRVELKQDASLARFLEHHAQSEEEAQANVRWNMHLREGIIPAHRPVTIYLQRPYGAQ